MISNLSPADAYGIFQYDIGNADVLEHSDRVVLQEKGGSYFSDLRVPFIDPHPPALPCKQVSGEEAAYTPANNLDGATHFRPFHFVSKLTHWSALVIH
jgi:hypothetical protein